MNIPVDTEDVFNDKSQKAILMIKKTNRLNSKLEKNQSPLFTLLNTEICRPKAMINAVIVDNIAKVIYCCLAD